MKIEEITVQHGREFRAIYVCEYCGFWLEAYGRDNENFYKNVLPNLRCIACGKTTNYPVSCKGKFDREIDVLNKKEV